MAGPLSGISGQGAALQQAQNLQQQQNQNTGLVGENDETEQQNNEVQPQGAPAAESQDSTAAKIHSSNRLKNYLPVARLMASKIVNCSAVLYWISKFKKSRVSCVRD